MKATTTTAAKRAARPNGKTAAVRATGKAARVPPAGRPTGPDFERGVWLTAFSEILGRNLYGLKAAIRGADAAVRTARTLT